VKVANVPRPAIEAAAPSAAIERRSFRACRSFRRMVPFSVPGVRRRTPNWGLSGVNWSISWG